MQAEYGISQPAVSQHLKVLRDNGFARVRAVGTRRLYAVDPEPLREADEWLEHFRRFWTPHLDALATELARGKRARRPRRTHPPDRRPPEPPGADRAAHAGRPMPEEPAAAQVVGRGTCTGR